jgi:hypothetical protein
MHCAIISNSEQLFSDLFYLTENKFLQFLYLVNFESWSLKTNLLLPNTVLEGRETFM